MAQSWLSIWEKVGEGGFFLSKASEGVCGDGGHGCASRMPRARTVHEGASPNLPQTYGPCI